MANEKQVSETKMKTAKQVFRGEKERAEAARWHPFSDRTTGPAEVMKEVTAETVKKIEAIFEQKSAKDPNHTE